MEAAALHAVLGRLAVAVGAVILQRTRIIAVGAASSVQAVTHAAVLGVSTLNPILTTAERVAIHVLVPALTEFLIRCLAQRVNV